MTDSPRLEEVFAAVLAEHGYGGLHQFEAFVYCTCMAEFTEMAGWRAHVAERLAARFEHLGCGTLDDDFDCELVCVDCGCGPCEHRGSCEETSE